MSKSLGNLVFVGDLCKEWDPAAVRLALLAHHYREDWDWRTDDGHAGGGGPAGAVAQRARRRRGDDGPGWRRAGGARRRPRHARRAARALDEEATAGRSVADGARLLGITL